MKTAWLTILMFNWMFLKTLVGDNETDAIIKGMGDLIYIPSIQFSATSYTECAEEFKKKNPNFSIFDKATINYSGVLEQNRFFIKSKVITEGQPESPDYRAAYNGETLCYLDVTGQPRISFNKSYGTKKYAGTTPPTTQLGTVLLSPYEFLFSTLNVWDMYFINPRLVAQRAEDSIKNAKIVSSSKNEIQLQFNHDDDGTGSYYLVTFSKKDNYYPIKYEKFAKRPGSSSFKLVQRLQVAELQNIATMEKKQIQFPRKIIFENFIFDWPWFTTRLSVAELSLVKEPDEDIFEIDPSLASVIWDSDNQVQIQLPNR
jgi:hypothetical protein